MYMFGVLKEGHHWDKRVGVASGHVDHAGMSRTGKPSLNAHIRRLCFFSCLLLFFHKSYTCYTAGS